MADLTTSSQTNPQRILVVDDERHITRLIQTSLERQGHSVMCAYDGRQAIEALEREDFDRVIVDLMMPYVDGSQVLKWIRDHDIDKHTWVGLMTAQADAFRDDYYPDSKYHADLYIKKPLNPTQLFGP